MGRTIYLVRHAEPDTGSGRKVYLGQKDVPLTREGERQAERLARWFAGKRLDGIFASPLTRTMHTARILAEKSGHGGEIMPVPGLMEMDLGSWDGLTFDEIRARDPAGYAARGKALGRFVTPGGESYEQAGARFAKAFFGILAQNTGDLLVVAHAGVIRAFLCMLTGTDIDELQKFNIPYASVTVLEEDPAAGDAAAEKTGAVKAGTGQAQAGRDGKPFLPAAKPVPEKDRTEQAQTDGASSEEERRKAAFPVLRRLHLRTAGLRPAACICRSEADRLWDACGVTPELKAHMEAVAGRAMDLIGCGTGPALYDRLPEDFPFAGGTINARLACFAALLHDIKRAEGGRTHAAAGAAYLRKEGYFELADIVERHHDAAVYRPGEPLSEAELVYLADKLVQGSTSVTLEERFAKSLEKCAASEARAAHEARYAAALGIAAKLGPG